jgi:6-phosphogluconate dehydrogenase
MVQAGAPVDAVIEQLLPLLDPGDIVIDGGNSLYTDTERRDAWLTPLGLRFVGAGHQRRRRRRAQGPQPSCPAARPAPGPRCAPSTKPSPRAWNGEPCVIHIGPGGAGHFVKMVHNGIEYGDMQLICEAYALFQAAGLTAPEIAAVFDQLEPGRAAELPDRDHRRALEQVDPDTGRPLVDLILDKAGPEGHRPLDADQRRRERGGGQHHQRRGGSACAVVDARAAQVAAAAAAGARPTTAGRGPRARWCSRCTRRCTRPRSSATRRAWTCCAAWARRRTGAWTWAASRPSGAAAASSARAFSNASRRSTAPTPRCPTWRWRRTSATCSTAAQQPWRQVVALAVGAGIPVPAFSASLAYYDSLRSARLPANLLQAQRDFFGAHTYERTDRPAGQFFHTHRAGHRRLVGLAWRLPGASSRP